MTLLDGYKIYKDVQGKAYHSIDSTVKEQLKQFRRDLGIFTDKIFDNTGLVLANNGKGMWQNSGNFTKYMWNRYRLEEDNKSNLVIYFNASTISKEGLFISIGLIDDKLNEYEKSNTKKIYDFLEEECKKIECDGFNRHDTDWGERVFTIIHEDNYANVDYGCLVNKLVKVYRQTLNKFYYQKNNKTVGIDMLKNKQPLNQILYGPPGTGKTYHTIDKALEIIDGEVPKSREEVKKRFEELKEAGQIEFVTFHQSYGYEEFVEGIKADIKSESIRYIIEDGIFKSLSDKARKHFEDSKKSQSEIDSEISQKDRIGDFLNTALEDEKIFQKTKGGKFGIKDLTEKSVILYSEDSKYNENSITLDVEEFYKIINANIEFKTSRQIAQEVFAISNQRQKDTYYLSLYKEYEKVPFSETKINIDMIENKNYILIIDEINRGNISKIFGELITLIEESKRLGSDESMEVTLPYSGEKFGVPKNLYIIGTMNTADRSIALMDTALRRRFEFEEMMPNPELLSEVDGIDLEKLLTTINKRIEYLYDRDHTIGHAYFMGVEDKFSLDNIMRNNVIPLLQEYFYDDWEKIQIILGDHKEQGKEEHDKFVHSLQNNEKDILGFNYDELDKDEYSYSINETFKEEAYLKIYE